MEVHRGLNGLQKKARGIALGIFDGVHLGHQALIRALLALCRERRLIPAALTFSFEGGLGFDGRPIGHAFIMNEEEKLQALEETGVSEVFLVSLTDEFSHLSPPDFLDQVIIDQLGGQVLAIGQDGRYGWHGEGDARFLEEYGPLHALSPLVVDDVLWEGEKVSSTRIRGLLSEGQVEPAMAVMTRPFCLSGQGKRGEEPSALVMDYPPTAALLAPGLYQSRLASRSGGIARSAVTCVSRQPSLVTLVCGEGPDVEDSFLSLEFLAFLGPVQGGMSGLEAAKEAARTLGSMC